MIAGMIQLSVQTAAAAFCSALGVIAIATHQPLPPGECAARPPQEHVDRRIAGTGRTHISPIDEAPTEAVIDSVVVKKVYDLTPREIEMDNPEFRLLEDELRFLEQIYNRDISTEDLVTVVRFSQILEKPQGIAESYGTSPGQLN